MKIKLNSKYRQLLNIIVWILSIGSLILAFFSLPVVLAVMIAILCFAFPLFIDRIIFKYHILWVDSGLTDLFFDRLGFSWFYSIDNNIKIPGISILFENRYEAKQAYSILKSWNFGAYKDLNGNIRISIIDENNKKYSIFVYPRDNKIREQQLIDYIKNKLPKNSEIHIDKKLFIWMQNCGDYSKRPEILEAISLIKESDKVFVNTSFVVNNKIRFYAKRSIQISKIKSLKRAELLSDDIEFYNLWEDPFKKYPSLSKRVSKIDFNNE
jgi:hypothetical protein